MAWLRASHFCGVEAFWFDNLLRLTGFNLELLTSASELRALNDEGEWSEVYRWSPFPWEASGVLEHTTDFTKHAADVYNDPKGRAGREPVEDDQMGIWRVQRFRGYLGDLERTVVALPAADALQSAAGIERLSNETRLPGLLDTGFTADGRWHVSSAKGVLLEKTVTIPVPKELILPDDATGDGPEDYKAAGAWGEGDSHEKKDPTLDDDQAGLRSLFALERHALLRDYYDNLTFTRHAKDWLLPTEQDAATAFGLNKAAYEPSTTIVDLDFWMPLPKAVELDIEARVLRFDVVASTGGNTGAVEISVSSG